LVDIEAAAFFNRNNESGDPLRIWEIKVRHAVEGAGAGLAQIKNMMAERPHLSDEMRAITSDIFRETSAAEMGDYPYAQMVLEFSSMLAQDPSGDMARLKIAEEMAAIGLPETALDVLAPNLVRPDAQATHIQAAAFVQLFEPAKALEVLAGDESLSGYKIRLNAYLQMENFAAVAQLLNDEYAEEISMNDVALRAGDWAKIQDAGAVGTLASYVQGGTVEEGNMTEHSLSPMTAEESPSLKAARDLLTENNESMQFLNEVLAEGQ